MRLLLDDTLATLPITEGVRAGLISSDADIVPVTGLTANQINATEAALIPAGEYGHLQTTHCLVPDLAVLFDRTGPVSMRTPVRPDEIEQSLVRLLDVSSTTELLARATMQSFFGITPEGFVREDAADAQIVVVEGALTLEPPEAGFDENLVRAWFILTGEAYPSHVLVIPVGASSAERDQMIETARQLVRVTVSRRREIRTRIVAATGLDRDRLTELFQTCRWELAEADQRALLMLLQLGNRNGEAGPYVRELHWSGDS